jgi:hypothetical protein
MCFVFIWGQTATCATYSIHWLVFITEMKSVYSAVRTGSLNKAVCASSLNVNIFCIYLRTNNDLCHLHHKPIGSYNRDEKCLQRVTDWVFKYSGLRFVFKGLILLFSVVWRRWRTAFMVGRLKFIAFYGTWSFKLDHHLQFHVFIFHKFNKTQSSCSSNPNDEVNKFCKHPVQ